MLLSTLSQTTRKAQVNPNSKAKEITIGEGRFYLEKIPNELHSLGYFIKVLFHPCALKFFEDSDADFYHDCR
jgi:hypothetical protein